MRYTVPTAINAEAQQLTLTTAVKDAAAGRLSVLEIGEAVSISQVGRAEFDALVAAQRIQLAADRETRDHEDVKRLRKVASIRPLADFYDGWIPQ